MKRFQWELKTSLKLLIENYWFPTFSRGTLLPLSAHRLGSTDVGYRLQILWVTPTMINYIMKRFQMISRAYNLYGPFNIGFRWRRTWLGCLINGRCFEHSESPDLVHHDEGPPASRRLRRYDRRGSRSLLQTDPSHVQRLPMQKRSATLFDVVVISDRNASPTLSITYPRRSQKCAAYTFNW